MDTTVAPDAPVPGVTFVGDLASGVAAAKAAAGDKYVNVLGAEVARQCLEAGVIEEILVCIAPVLLGDGVRLLDHPGGTRAESPPGKCPFAPSPELIERGRCPFDPPAALDRM